MTGRSLQKCFAFICLFFMCPKNKFRIQASPAEAYNYGAKYSNPNNKYLPAKWSLNIVRDKDSLISGLDEAEPGFNLTEDEITKFKIWRQGMIPYYIDDFSFDKVLRDRIRNYLHLTNHLTGLRFMELPKPPPDEKTRWVLFVNRQGLLNCADHSIKDFTNEGVQKVILGYDCLVTGGELAEAVMALVGVPPQHNSPDRQKHIKIIDANIISDKKHLFVALKNSEWLFHDVPYDYFSASHYSLHKYTKNGFATITLMKPTDVFIGEGKGFSYNDIWKIRMLYNYILRKKENSVKASDCIKLFEPGTNFSNYQPLLEDKIQPRNKPNKYLGKDDLPQQTDNKKNSQNGAKADVDKDIDSERSSEENIYGTKNQTLSKEYDEENDNKTGKDYTKVYSKEKSVEEKNDSEEENSEHEITKNENLVTLKYNKNKNNDPLSENSDYKSWETTKTAYSMQRKFTKVRGK